MVNMCVCVCGGGFRVVGVWDSAFGDYVCESCERVHVFSNALNNLLLVKSYRPGHYMSGRSVCKTYG